MKKDEKTANEKKNGNQDFEKITKKSQIWRQIGEGRIFLPKNLEKRLELTVFQRINAIVSVLGNGRSYMIWET